MRGGRLARMLRRRAAVAIGLAVVATVALAALLAPWLHLPDPTKQDLRAALRPPAWSANGSWDHPLGTDQFGRDMLSRLVWGARVSLLTATLAALVAAVIGVVVGLLAGYYGGRVDAALMRLVDLHLAFPLTLLALAMVAVLGPSLRNLAIVMGVTGWMIYARVVRGVTLALRGREFVLAARALGAGDGRVIGRHILPNVMGTVIVLATLEFARLLLMESSLSFLGLGVPPPAPTWGRMLADARDYASTAYWTVVWPGGAIMAVVLGINLLGDGLRDALDPRLQQLL